jgi:hypothetical protein
MNRDDLRQLIEAGESETADFKQIYHENNSRLVHDILCLANAGVNMKRDRLIIFGISDSGNVVGVQSDPNRKDTVKVNDLLSNIRFNRKPLIRIETIHLENNIEIDVLIIDDLPWKPFFLTVDYTNRGDSVRAGVIYSRRESRNTPLSNEGIDDHELEIMFVERFGLNRPAIDRLEGYLKDHEDWEELYDGSGGGGYFYSIRPEFHFLIERNEQEIDLRSESWANLNILGGACRFDCIFKYHTTTIRRLQIMETPSGDYSLCWPERGADGNYFFKRSSIEYILSCFLREKSMRGKTYDFEKLGIPIID